jgi:uncharacterized integral membrane protein (TIGR00697 family)
MMLVSDVTAGKIIQLFIFPVSVTVLYYPITYIFSDIFTEVYGYSRARSVLWKVICCSVLAMMIYQIAIRLPPTPGFIGNEAYTRVLGQVPRVLFGGYIALFIGQVSNNFILAKMKILTNGKYLWARTIGSTIIGEFLDTFLFYTIALYNVIPNNLLVKSVLSGWFLKVMVETVFTPITYFVVGKLKKLENEDYYDRRTDFNPLIVD